MRTWIIIKSGICSFTQSCNTYCALARLPDVSQKVLSFTNELYFVIFYGHQMYFGGSVVGKDPTTGREISPTPPLIFTGGQKVQNLASFKTSLNFEPHMFANAAQDIRILKQKCNAAMMALCSDQVWWSWVHPPLEKALSVMTHPINFTQKRAKSSIKSTVDYSILLKFWMEFICITPESP